MAGLGITCRASSLMECVVASLILLLGFTLSLEVLTRLTAGTPAAHEQLLAVQAVRGVWQELKSENPPEGEWFRAYDRGQLHIVVVDYSAGVNRLILTAVPRKGGAEMQFSFLIKKEPL